MLPQTLDEFSNGLCLRTRPLITQIMQRESACAVLELFRQRPLTWFEVDDIVYHLRCSHVQVTEELSWLTETQILQCRPILGLAFYRLTNDSEIMNALGQFWAWREHWYVHLEQVKLNLGHHTTRHALATWASAV